MPCATISPEVLRTSPRHREPVTFGWPALGVSRPTQGRRYGRAVPDFIGADLRGARFHRVDLSGAEFRIVDLSNVVMRGVALVDVDITGEVRNVTINGVDVGPLITAE